MRPLTCQPHHPAHPDMQNARPLWKCPRCSRFFANRNQTHSCGLRTVNEHFVRSAPHVRALFDQFLGILQELGPVIVLPEKTRIAFQVRMSFAQVTPRREWLDGHLVLAERVDDERFTRVETFSPRNHLHAFRLRDKRDLDRRFVQLMTMAYRVGAQEHRRAPRPDAG
jgi:hypothetical protein